jgi:hypothetical protein
VPSRQPHQEEEPSSDRLQNCRTIRSMPMYASKTLSKSDHRSSAIVKDIEVCPVLRLQFLSGILSLNLPVISYRFPADCPLQLAIYRTLILPLSHPVFFVARMCRFASILSRPATLSASVISSPCVRTAGCSSTCCMRLLEYVPWRTKVGNIATRQ